jgi:integrase
MGAGKNRNTPTTRKGTVPIVYAPARNRWQLTLYVEGKRTRSFHPTEAEAEREWRSHCHRVRRFGTDSGEFSPADHAEFREAKRIVSGADLRDVAAFWRSHHPEGAIEATVAEAWTAFLAEKSGQGLSARHLESLRHHCAHFADAFATRRVRSVTAEEVRRWLLALRVDPRTLANHRGSLSNFFNWCARRRFVETSPTDGIHDADLPAVRPKAKGVLTVDQCASMMTWLADNRPKLVPWHALQLFAGIRRAEVARLRWDWIDLEARTVTLPGWSAGERIVKTGDDWVLHDLPANLWPWLAEFRGTGEKIVAPTPEAIAELRAEQFPKIGIPTWPANAMRHTFCTMLMSLHGDAAKVANWSRHTNPAQLYRSYVARLVSREEAERFTEILPRQA